MTDDLVYLPVVRRGVEVYFPVGVGSRIFVSQPAVGDGENGFDRPVDLVGAHLLEGICFVFHDLAELPHPHCLVFAKGYELLVSGVEV